MCFGWSSSKSDGFLSPSFLIVVSQTATDDNDNNTLTVKNSPATSKCPVAAPLLSFSICGHDKKGMERERV